MVDISSPKLLLCKARRFDAKFTCADKDIIIIIIIILFDEYTEVKVPKLKPESLVE
jgi:hypothetical protein